MTDADSNIVRLQGQVASYLVDLSVPPFQAGGQGQLFHARTDDVGDLVVKLYHRGRDVPAVRDGITALAHHPAPGPAFLWPLDLVEYDGRFGYVMPLAPPTFAPLHGVLTNEVSLTFRMALTGALHIVEGFRQIHSGGLYYCDISSGNVLIDPDTGRVLICDNDNVGTSQRPATIQGTPGFMAPEVGRRDVPPSAGSDKFSLGVLLFLLLIGEHPLEGRRDADCAIKTQRDLDEMYCISPVFVFDPTDDSNRPVAGWQDNALVRWPMFPEQLRLVFEQLFTSGLNQPGRRPSFVEWNLALLAARDLLTRCANPECQAEGFALPSGLDPDDSRCWACGHPTGGFGRLTITAPSGRSFGIVLGEGAAIHDFHLTGRVDRAVLASPMIGAVVENPAAPGVWGIRNLTAQSWRSTFPSGEVIETAPGRAVALRDGVRISFTETASGTIEFPPDAV
jgi:eukaryotic-like serine/threonine-protein kinase